MAGDRRLKRAAVAALAVAASTALSGCGGGSMFGSSGGSSSGSSFGSRFSQLFGSKSQEASTASSPSTQATENSDLTCPSVAIRFGASTLSVGLPGKPASGSDLRYQGTITRTARDCNLQGGQITARIGIVGRIIAGPAGAPPTVDVPMRVAVVEDGAPEKVITTKAIRTTVTMEGENTEFSLVAEDITYPTPTETANDKYVFYIGFDPAALKPEPARGRKKK
ncbi:hypothetical protein [Bradyrhizobium sp. G127]|uniref:hypothetical protein n=1 Tax=Bradyrhizobium sp. G127 TaxID=2904800 RepID=UPI001F2E58DB|nr:hypothetical protein [Bradyrhizobium sp. G127]MCF2525176.1 hypothetical protein [Bradyrhizobium sp. G127]